MSDKVGSLESVDKIDWPNAILLLIVHIFAIAGIAYIAAGACAWQTLVFAFIWNLACGLAITAGYHRLFSHCSYQAPTWLRFFYAVFGAFGVQNSILDWCAHHRPHHAHVDTPRDPYNAKRGFWWSHVGWVIHRNNHDYSWVRDLERDPVVRWQKKYYIALVMTGSLVIPTLVPALWGDLAGGFLVASALRLAAQYFSTFSVNSFAHMFGSRPFSRTVTACNNWLVGLITLGEAGGHADHHAFSTDYRAGGLAWWYFDPTKWFIWTLEKLGIVTDVVRISREKIKKALVQ